MKPDSARSNQRKLAYCRIGAPVMKSNSSPEAVELAPPGLVEHQLGERAVVAEVARHAVEPGAQQPPGVALAPPSGRGRRGPAPRR